MQDEHKTHKEFIVSWSRFLVPILPITRTLRSQVWSLRIGIKNSFQTINTVDLKALAQNQSSYLRVIPVIPKNLKGYNKTLDSKESIDND